MGLSKRIVQIQESDFDPVTFGRDWNGMELNFTDQYPFTLIIRY